MPWDIPHGRTVNDLLWEASERAQHTFDLSSVYDWQLEACRAILEKRDCILSAPTGGGKTLAFYLPLLAFCDPTTENASNQPITLIVSPLVELMNQQANDLNEKGIPAVALCGDNLRDKGLTSYHHLIELSHGSKTW
ncbi:hypothetical protein M422DRAFT_193900 [Sphaerobolus stellatus SS14]|uniref:DNA 3'-5' helicase n=1 Tax=Sphaerobolus stellatus (strain SS14) TaxID=990650 RepID=A0A0C9T7S4_SPHS4|nr:hypothetical protein M422DRAFT_193900 [Sphaerobolus stellatus SS14]